MTLQHLLFLLGYGVSLILYFLCFGHWESSQSVLFSLLIVINGLAQIYVIIITIHFVLKNQVIVDLVDKPWYQKLLMGLSGVNLMLYLLSSF